MFRNITEVKRANKALGHHWFEADPSREHRRETDIIGGFYWVESSWDFNRTNREFLAVAASPDGAIQYLHGAERFATLAEAKAIIDAIVDGRDE